MLSNLSINKAILYALLAFTVLLFLLSAFDTSNLITVLNGVFVGTMLSITVAYGPLFWKAIIGDQSVYPDARQLTAGFFITWAAYGFTVYASTHVRMMDLPTTPLFETAISRYLAILGAIVQITAADYGKGVFYGRDRKTLYYAGGIGFVVGLIVIALQASNALALPL